ncbi:MAG: hypothetical protein WAU47_13630, partial [Desulfobaccales bacterium]
YIYVSSLPGQRLEDWRTGSTGVRPGSGCRPLPPGPALILQPQVLLLDEPFAALDGFLRAAMRRVLLEVQARFRIPVVLITHDPEDVNTLAQTVVVYDMGRVHRQVNGDDFFRTLEEGGRDVGSMGILPVPGGAGSPSRADTRENRHPACSGTGGNLCSR